MDRVARALRYWSQGWGRRAAWPMLFLFLALQLGAAATLRHAAAGAVRPLSAHAAAAIGIRIPVMIVAIDDASLAAVGQWPWPRQIDAELVQKILAGHPAALGIDLLWSEPDRQSPEQLLPSGRRRCRRRCATPSASCRAMTALLGNAIAGQPVVLGVGGLRQVARNGRTPARCRRSA